MEALIAWAWPYVLGAGAALVAAWRVWAAGKQAGRDAERAKHAAQERENLDRIKRAADARPTVGVRDDPFNRDR